MNYTTFDMGSYHIHVIKTDHFKSVNVRINFKRPIKKEEITIRNFLNDILLESSKKYQNRREIVIETENLYNLSFRNSTVLSGNYIISMLNAAFLNEQYTEPGMLKKSMAFLMELLFHPNIKNNQFDQKSFELVYKALEEEIISAKDNPTHYAMLRMMEEMDAKLPLSFAGEGYIEDLKKITPTNLYEYYKSMIHSDIIDIFVCGNVDPNEIKQIFSDSFKINTLKRKQGSHYLTHNKIRMRAKSVKEKKDTKQSKLVMGCKVGALKKQDRIYAGYIYNLILGASPDSKLFREVREKNSLCYSVSSRYQNLNSVLTIQAGIDKENYKKTVSLIKKQMKDIAQGKFSEEDIEKAKVIYVSGCQGLFDSPASINSTYISYVYLDADPVEERIENISKVTREDVIHFAKHVHLDTIFLLEGENHE